MGNPWTCVSFCVCPWASSKTLEVFPCEQSLEVGTSTPSAAACAVGRRALIAVPIAISGSPKGPRTTTNAGTGGPFFRWTGSFETGVDANGGQPERRILQDPAK
eukprot:8896693-Pyramimonas_sp.AAC.1